MSTHSHTVPASARGQRLDAFLALVEPDLSRSRLKTLIEEGSVTLNGKPTKPSKLLQGEETVTMVLSPARPIALAPETIALNVLYEDAQMLVLDKAAGMTVHPGAGNFTGTLVNALLAHCHDLAGIGGELRPGIVHRLDKDTSGCMVVAKTERALASLQAQFRSHQVEKTYWALVHGTLPASGRFETLHGRHPVDRKRFSSHVTQGRTAITEWSRLEQYAQAALVQVSLRTGRTHQIRMHFSEAGHPLLHDTLYGGRRREARLPEQSEVKRAAQAIGRQALHARVLGLRHPTTGSALRFEAPIPSDFEQALAVLTA